MKLQHTTLLAIPVYNEQDHIRPVLSAVIPRAGDILVIDDGSDDLTPRILTEFPVEIVRHAINRGYGRSMQQILHWAVDNGYEWVVTMDCDLQHEPAALPLFAEMIAMNQCDVISGSRYLQEAEMIDQPPVERRTINQLITTEINHRLGLELTDAFCGFKAYRTACVAGLPLDIDGYDFPMQFWVAAAAADLRISEVPVDLIYNDPNRSFGGPLDDPGHRLSVYRKTLHRALLRHRDSLDPSAYEDLLQQVTGAVSQGTP